MLNDKIDLSGFSSEFLTECLRLLSRVDPKMRVKTLVRILERPTEPGHYWAIYDKKIVPVLLGKSGMVYQFADQEPIYEPHEWLSRIEPPKPSTEE